MEKEFIPLCGYKQILNPSVQHHAKMSPLKQESQRYIKGIKPMPFPSRLFQKTHCQLLTKVNLNSQVNKPSARSKGLERVVPRVHSDRVNPDSSVLPLNLNSVKVENTDLNEVQRSQEHNDPLWFETHQVRTNRSGLSRKERMLLKKSFQLNDLQRDIIVGTLLGDASIPSRNGKPDFVLKFEQSEKTAGYIKQLHKDLMPYSGAEPTYRVLDKTTNRKAIGFKTNTHPHIVYYENAFYTRISDPGGRKKMVPKNIEKYLNARVLAYWFMDDGTYHEDQKTKVRNYLFSTQGFTKSENDLLASCLRTKFGLTCSVNKDKNYYRILIWRKSSEGFLNLIRPYIHNDFLYKIDPFFKKK